VKPPVSDSQEQSFRRGLIEAQSGDGGFEELDGNQLAVGRFAQDSRPMKPTGRELIAG